MAVQQLDLSPRSPLLDPAPVYWYSLLLRIATARNDAWNTTALDFGGPNQYYRSTLTSTASPSMYVGVFGVWTVIVIGGTDPVNDQWTQNVLGSYQVNIAGIPGKVHAGFAGYTASLFINLQTILAGLLPHANTVVIGHSLGGACANLIAWLLHQVNPGCVRLVVTEGAPRAGDIEFALSAPWSILRIENLGDPVPEVPPQTASSIGAVVVGPAFGPCDFYVPAGQGVQFEVGGAVNSTTGTAATEVARGVLAGLWEQGFSVAALPHTANNYALRIRRWIGANWPPEFTRGLNVDAIDGYQDFISGEEGFNWVV